MLTDAQKQEFGDRGYLVSRACCGAPASPTTCRPSTSWSSEAAL